MAMCHVLLLGGIGSGKSTVARYLAESGIETIHSDQIGHEVLDDEEARREIAAEWPSVIVDDRVDRRRLAGIVFADRSQLSRLEAITHPRIRERLSARVAAVKTRVVVVEMPLLRDLVDGEWWRVVVDAPAEVRIARLISRGMPDEEARARVQLQPIRDDYLAVADYVIDNSGSEASLRQEIERVLEFIDECGEHDIFLGPTSDARHRMLPE